ncbi:hypothetical protein Fmac_027460 [Flemingia macrophylla]|uniref:Ubiquitin-like domain-containing protein n=1 Tax=Flemingia macrophylla TaxID=520843 RepID=A0ABD1LHT4_9FABA
MEIGYFDTVLEIKEKVNKYQNIPVSNQTLILNGQVLQDIDDPWKVEILHNSRIQLEVNNDDDNNNNKETSHNNKKNNNNNNKEVLHNNNNKKNNHNNNNAANKNIIHLNVKVASKTQVVPLEVDANDTVWRVKERIQEMENVSVSSANRVVLHASTTGVELQEHQLLRECDVTEIDVSYRASAAASGKNRLKLMVLPKSGTKKVPVEVNACDNVGELRKELQKLQQRLQFHLPQDGYFFIYKQNVMDDDRSFRWHHVAQGDTIEIFNGSVSGGS